MAKSVSKNYFYNVIYEVLVIVIPLITSPYLTRTLGAEKLGIYTYTYTIVSYFVLFARLGIVNHGSREIAKCKSPDERNKVFSTIFSIQAVITLVVIATYIFYITFFNVEYKFIATVQIMYLVAAFLDVNWALFGLEEFKLTVTRNIVIKILNTVLIFVLVRSEGDLLIYVLISACSNLIGQIVIWSYIKKYFRIVKPEKVDVHNNLKPIFVLFIPTIAVSLYKMMDKVMLGSMCLKEEVAYYEYATMFINLPLGFITSLGTVMMPRISKLVSEGNNKKSLEYTSISMIFVICLSTAMAFGLAGIAPTFIPWYLGEDFSDSVQLLIGLCVTLLFISWANVIRTQYLIPYKKDNEYIISLLAAAVINLIINYTLIPIYKGMGAVIGTIAAEFIVAFLQTIFSRKNLPIKDYLKKGIPFIFFGLLMFVVVRLIGRSNLYGVVLVCIQVIVGAVLYLSLSLIYSNFALHIPIFKMLKGRRKS